VESTRPIWYPKKAPAITKAMIRKAVSIDFCLKVNTLNIYKTPIL
jgi:hypothetical protein